MYVEHFNYKGINIKAWSLGELCLCTRPAELRPEFNLIPAPARSAIKTADTLN